MRTRRLCSEHFSEHSEGILQDSRSESDLFEDLPQKRIFHYEISQPTPMVTAHSCLPTFDWMIDHLDASPLESV